MKQISYLFILLLFIYSPLVLATDTHDHDHSDHKEPELSNHHEHDTEHEAHDDHDHEHEKTAEPEYEDHEDAEIKLSDAELEEFSIQLAQAKPGFINKTIDLTGEVIVAPESLYHVVPRVSGVVRKIFKHLGEKVQAGDILATLSSRELADTKAQFVAADSLLQLANTNLHRERNLYKSNVSAKRKYMAAQQVQAEMSINRQAAKQRLLSIGLTEAAVASVLENKDTDLTLYQLRSPAEGVIIEKHASQGEVLDTSTRSFTVANLSQVWVNLTVYQKDLPYIHQGQQETFAMSRFFAGQRIGIFENFVAYPDQDTRDSDFPAARNYF